MTSYDATTKTAGPLLGDSSVLMIQSRMRNLLGTLIPNNGSVSALSDIGVAFQKDGTLAFDQTKLDAALGSNPQAVATLFASTGSASDSLVGYKAATRKTQPGSYHSRSLNWRPTAHGQAHRPGLTITAGVNDALRSPSTVLRPTSR
jgi:flagellar hook-associated protein 2